MTPDEQLSGQAPFRFAHRPDLSFVPQAAQEFEVNLHGGSGVDGRAGFGQIYYGMPGCGIIRIEADMSRQDILKLPDALRPLNLHSTKLGQFDGQWRLFMTANNAQQVVVLSLEGQVEFTLPRPVFEQYQDQAAPYAPTDTVLVGQTLYIADGYGSNYISSADIITRQWMGIFGGRTEDPLKNGKFMIAHGLTVSPVHHHLDIADRPLARIQSHGEDGHFIGSHKLPAGSVVCGLNYAHYRERWYGVIGCLQDPAPNRPAPIYIIDAETYELLSVIRPKEELGIDLAQHLHDVVFHVHAGQLYLICQAWNPGHYFVLQMA